MPDWSGGSTAAWRKVRAQVLKRDSYRCQLRLDPKCDCTFPNCKQFHGCTTIATCVHHLYGKARGDDPKDLVASCQGCNLQIGNPGKTQTDPPIRARTNW